MEEVSDSQSDPLLDIDLSWDTLNTDKEKSTRKAHQLDRLRKSLKPLTNEYKESPTTRGRNTSFQKNNQFTVTAAEFLNLSSKNELDQLFQDGYTKNEIEDMLENKYAKKREFFTENKVKHHQFKRKTFESWRSVGSSNNLANDTFLDEEGLISSLDKSLKFKLRNINKKPLRLFRSKKSKSIQHTNYSEIPKENGILGSSIDENSSLIITNEKSNISKNEVEIVDSSSVVNDDSNNEAQETTEKNKFYPDEIPNIESHLETIEENNDEEKNDSIEESIQDNNAGEPPSEHSQEHNIFSFLETQNSPIEKTSFNMQPSSPFTSNQKQLFDELDTDLGTRTSFNEDKDLEHVHNESIELIDASSNLQNDNENAVMEMVEAELKKHRKDINIPEVFDVVHTENSFKVVPENEIISASGRHLRHRNIVNRNPYLVDRAEYLGLSTRYELISMENEGKSDDNIMHYLDTKYQKRRAERRDNDVGYGPYSKESFYKIMDGMNVLNETQNNLVGLNVDDNSDEEFSVDEEDNDNDLDNMDNGSEQGEDEEDDEEDDGNLELCKHDISPINAYKTKSLNSKRLKDNSKDISISGKRPKISKDNNPNSKRSKSSSNTLRKSHNQNDIQIQEDDQVFDFTIPKIPKSKKSIRDIVSSTQISRSTSSFKPYSMEFLSLSDEEVGPLNKSAKQPSVASLESSEFKERGANYKEQTKKLSVQRSLIDKKVQNVKENKTLPYKRSSPTELKSPTKKAKKDSNKENKHKKGVIASSFAPVNDQNFVFSRRPNVETIEAEGVAPNILNNKITNNIPSFEIDNARNTNVNLQTITSTDDKLPETENITNNSETVGNSIDKNWGKFKSIKDIEERKYRFILCLKVNHYTELSVPDSFLNSSLLSKCLSEDQTYYRAKDIKIVFSSSSFVFQVPLKSESTYSKLQAFFDIMLGAIQVDIMNITELKQLRKCLIHIIMIISNAKKDCPDLLSKIGLEINSFLNKFKKITDPNALYYCIFAPYFLLFVKMLQNMLPEFSEYYSSFKKTEIWITKKFTSNIISIDFENLFIRKKTIALESLKLFLKCTNNPWMYITDAFEKSDIKILNLVNYLIFCSAYKKVEMDWEIFTKFLVKYANDITEDSEKKSEIKYLFASILKINRELGWELEDQLIVKLFRLLAEYKFENIGSSVSDKPSIYPNIPATDSLETDDGCLDIYFKLIDIFAKQYLTENTKQMIERIVPVRSTFGYSPIQLQNRAKVILMLVYIFDQDLLSGLESILTDMIRNGSIYSMKSALALLRTIIRSTPRRPYNTVRNFLPSIISKMKNMNTDREIFVNYKDLIIDVNSTLNGQDVSHMKRMLDFFSIILKLKFSDTYCETLETVYNSSFDIIRTQFEFTNGVDISNKDSSRIKKAIHDIAKYSKMRLIDEKLSSHSMKLSYLRYWLFSSSKNNDSAMQILYTDWNYFGNKEFRERFEVEFFNYLVTWFDVSSVIKDVLMVFFKHLTNFNSDIFEFYNSILEAEIITVSKDKFKNLNKMTFQQMREKITIMCLSQLFQSKQESPEDIKLIIEDIVSVLYKQLNDYSARDFIRNISFYLFTVAENKIDLPEWKILMNKLKIETIAESLHKKLQFVETVDDIALVLEKSYISSLATNEYSKFETQFSKVNTNNENYSNNTKAMCALITFHIERIKTAHTLHWIHFTNWMQNLGNYVSAHFNQPDIFDIMHLFCALGDLKSIFIESEEYHFYYYHSLTTLYNLFDKIAAFMFGFADQRIFLKNADILLGMDPNNDAQRSENKGINHFDVLLDNSLKQRLSSLFDNSHSLLVNKVSYQNDGKVISYMEKELKVLRVKIANKWGIESVLGIEEDTGV
ncbi:hypothetical protein DAPK24_027710 [Pichia kluyveri]|uniref:Uncharacterized protein n=1 Tax=Pichia kluyveri TaxID=36015 RepID=A0AAV5R6G4_PICKL|nr:hypothetical protein DAPK24_027710 [Pichia kluyveri]